MRTPKLLPASNGNDVNGGKNTLNVEPESSTKCDAAFFDCIGRQSCNSCYIDMETHDIDWAVISKDSQCETILGTLQSKGFCKSLGTGQSEDRDAFCKTFTACVVFDNGTPPDDKSKKALDCSALTTCDWEGMHKSFLGDGVCQDALFDTCYNTAICGFDGGDCCEDTCHSKNAGQYQEILCGTDGYACRDSSSTLCDPTLSLTCPPESYKNTDASNSIVIPTCSKDQSLYQLVMYDSFGDGWEDTRMTITPTTGASEGQKLTPTFSGGLKTGAEGTEYLCLSLNPMCYHVDVTGGTWGREASWYVKGFAKGAPAIASGGGSMSCDFSVAGGSCQNTCTGTSNHAPGQDPQYRDFKKMVLCIDDKCMLQVATCEADPSCEQCYSEEIPDYCYSIESFLAITDCAMCKCSGIEDSLFCNDKQAPGIIIPSSKDGGQEGKPKACTPAETESGGYALMDFSTCMNFDQTTLMITDFDTNNFGALDTFEACAHAYSEKSDHGGHTALSCLQILVNAINVEVHPDEPTAAIAQIASMLYNNGEHFCDCAKKASKDCPLCPSFYNFKTLIYEAMDACASLDNIDCAAWNEFQPSCKVNLMAKFGSVNFAQQDQCDFMTHNNCGGTLPFPAFRRFDCQSEIPESAWDFYTEYSKFCLSPIPGTPAPSPKVTPGKPPIIPYNIPVDPNRVRPGPYNQAPTSEDSKKDEKRSKYKSPDEKRESHWFRNLTIVAILCGIAYFLYKRQSDGFNFVRYRRMTNFGAGGSGRYGMDDNDMFSGLSLESSTTFEPPSLPPTPMSMPSNGGYGA